MQTRHRTPPAEAPPGPALLEVMSRKLAAAMILAAAAVGAWILMAPEGGNPLAAAGARLQLASAFGDSAEYDLSELRYFYAAAAKVNGEYVDPTRVHPDEMLVGALDKVGRRVPEFLYTLDEESRLLEVVVGSDRTEIKLPALQSVADLTGVVRMVAVFVDEHLDAEVERPPIEYALMNGMLETLDPHSVFIEPDYYREMQIQNKGHFGGLGITIGIREQRLTILYPLKETPAWRAGLKAGDRIDRIGNESTVNMTLQEAVGKLRGEIGTEVTITVSDEENPDREVTITRAKIEVPSVEWAYAGDGIGLIEVAHFAQQTYDRIEDALEELENDAIEDKQGRLKGVIFDLRGNPGGYLQEAIEVADKFLDDGVIVSTEGLAGTAREDTQARKFGTEDELPLVLLVDEASASASEIVAGALQMHDRAVVLGVRTFGKGSVQNLYDRDFHEGALKLTIAQYKTGGLNSIQGVGVLPDVELRPALVKIDEDGDRRVQLFWQDFEFREEDLDNPFEWGSASGDDAIPAWVYSCDECFESIDFDHETGPADNLSNPEVQAAKHLLMAAPSARASEMLEAAEETFASLLAPRVEQLQTKLAEQGIDWSPAPAGRKPRKGAPPATLKVSLKVGAEGVLTPGLDSEVELTVTNTSDRPLYRLRAITGTDGRSRYFRGREFVFGKLEPGETGSFAVSTKPGLWLNARTEEVVWHFFADGGPAPAPFVSRLQIEEVPRPRFAFSWQVVDGGTPTSRGNGDGLLQAGEDVDLVVSVQNIGNGATSDIWLANQDAADSLERKSGFISLRNRSSEALFLTEGSAQFSLEPGETEEYTLHFRVADDVAGRDSIEAQLSVGDENFLEVVSSDLEVPLFAPSDPISAVDRRMKPKGSEAEVRGGTSEHTEHVATISGPVQVDGRLGQWFRVQLPWGTPGWIAASQLVPAAKGDELGHAERHLSNSPPVVSLAHSVGGTVVSGDSLVLTGTVVDNDGVQDLFVFINDKKVSYERVEGVTSSHPFELTIALVPGENQIEIYARDAEDHLGSLSMGVYRETATAAAPAGERGAVVR